jgi:hypothetical protein
MLETKQRGVPARARRGEGEERALRVAAPPPDDVRPETYVLTLSQRAAKLLPSRRNVAARRRVACQLAAVVFARRRGGAARGIAP